MINFFVNRKVSTVMFVSFFILLGVLSYFDLSIERDPQIQFPLISIKIVYPGASPNEVERDVLEEIEKAVIELSDIKNVISNAYNDFGLVMVEFNLEIDVDVKLMEVKSKVEEILNDLPDVIDKPIIKKFNPLETPIIDLALSSSKHSLVDLHEFFKKELRPLLASINGIASINKTGAREAEIKILLDPNLMKEKNITISEVMEAVKEYNINIPAGQIEDLNSTARARFNGKYHDLKEIENMLLSTFEGGCLCLKEIASVKYGEKKIESIAFYDSSEVIIISLVKASDGNAVAIAKQLKQQWPRISTKLKEGMDLSIVNNTTENTIKETYSTIINIIIGIFLTSIVLIVFIGDYKTTLIATLVLISSLISTLFFVEFSNFTINSMTLLAFATVLGTLIANAIIILESSISKMNEGEDAKTAAINGTKAVIPVILASSGTNLAVFFPIAFMGGIVGKFMIQFGITVVYATVVSIIISFTLTPMLIVLLVKQGSYEKDNVFVQCSKKFTNFIIGKYNTLLGFILDKKLLTVCVSILLFIASLSTLRLVGNEFIPNTDLNKIEINLKTPLGSSIYNTAEKAKLVQNKLGIYPEIKTILTKIGKNGAENVTILLKLVDTNKRHFSDIELAQKIHSDISSISDISFVIRRSDEGTGDADLTIHVIGTGYDKMVEFSTHIERVMHDTNLFHSVSLSHRVPKNEYQFIPNQKTLTEFGISNYQISSTMRNSIYGNKDNVYSGETNDIDVHIGLPSMFLDDLKVFENMYVRSPKGIIPIIELGEIIEKGTMPDLMRRNCKRIIQIDGYLIEGTSGQARNILDEQIKSTEFDDNDNLNYYYAGDIELQEESEKELAKAFLLAVALTYMLLSAVMNSFLYPLIISSSILTSFSGVFVFLLLTNSSINIASMLAMIMVVGLTVNSAILLIDGALNEIRQGESIAEAILKGVKGKIRAIIMTSIAIISGVFPQIMSSDPIKSSMGAVVIGSMCASLFFTLVLTPVLILVYEKLKSYLYKRSAKA